MTNVISTETVLNVTVTVSAMQMLHWCRLHKSYIKIQKHTHIRVGAKADKLYEQNVFLAIYTKVFKLGFRTVKAYIYVVLVLEVSF